ncbi:MAG TPA: PQQ-binding-like beta-propeller repeat protein [Rudaea sp.]|nr:PQQ-binding-like beta-propeller repeat protein [Rudaea sp.]
MKRIATCSFALVVVLSGASVSAQVWDWTFRPTSANRVDSQPDSLSTADARGFWSLGTGLVHYHSDGSLDFVAASQGVQGGSLATTLSDGSLIVAIPSHLPQISFGAPIWCFVIAYSAQGAPRWTQVTQGQGPCAQLTVDATDTIWVRDQYSLTALSADGVMRNSDANADLVGRPIADVVARPRGGAAAAAAHPASIVALDARMNSVWVADDALAAAVYDRLVVDSDGNVFALGRISNDIGGAALHVRSVTATGAPRFVRDIDTIKTDIVLAGAAAPDGGLYLVSRQYDATSLPAIALTRLAADASVLWNQRVAANACSFYMPTCPIVVTAQGDVLFVARVNGESILYRFDANGQALQSTALADGASSLTDFANGDALVAQVDKLTGLGTALLRFDRNGAAQPPPPTSGLVPDMAYTATVLESTGESYLVVNDTTGHVLVRVDADGAAQWQSPRIAGYVGYGVDHGGNRVCSGAYIGGNGQYPRAFTVNCLAADSGAPAWSAALDSTTLSAPLRVLEDGTVLVFDLLDIHSPQHVLFAADGSVLHRTAVNELGNYAFPAQTREYITASGTAVLQRNDGLHLAAYDRNGTRLYDVEMPEQIRGANNFASAAVHVLPDGSAVLTRDNTDATTATAYAWKVSATGTTQWLQALTPARPLGTQGYRFANLFAAGIGDVLYFATSDVGGPATLQARAGATGQLLWEHANIAGDVFDARLSTNPATGDLVLVLPGPEKIRLLAIDGATGAVRKQNYESCSAGGYTDFCLLVDAGISADDTLRVLAPADSASNALFGMHEATRYAQLVRVDQPGIAGAWFPIYSAGQGFTLDYIASANTVFMPWFTFTQDGLYDPAGLAWFALQGNPTSAAGAVDLVIARTEPGVFNSGSAATVTVGNAHLNFTDCNSATLFYQFDAGTNGGAGGLITLTRLTPGTSPCIQSDGSTTPAQIANTPANGFDARQSGSWYDPATSGQGLEMTIIPAGNGSNGLVFAAWFTFDPAGRSDDPVHQHWFTLQSDLANATNGKVSLPVYRIIGGTFDGAATQNFSQVGHAILTMQGCDAAQLDYQFDTTEVTHAFAGLAGTTHLTKIGGCSSQ